MRTVDGKPLLPPLNPESVVRTEEWVVYKVLPDGGLQLIESQRTNFGAQRGVVILTEHERSTARDTVYRSAFAPDR